MPHGRALRGLIFNYLHYVSSLFQVLCEDCKFTCFVLKSFLQFTDVNNLPHALSLLVILAGFCLHFGFD